MRHLILTLVMSMFSLAAWAQGDLSSYKLGAGDVITIDETSFEVLAVGDVANENLMNLGHLNLKANGLHEAELPGDVNIPVVELPEVEVGTRITIIRN